MTSLVFVLLLLPEILKANIEPVFKESDAINPFSKDYITTEYTANYPTGNGNEYFDTGFRKLIFGYTHFLSEKWGVGLSIGFKSFKRKDIDREFALLSLSNESFYITRLYHPVYFLIGTKLLYMTPNQRSKLPPLRDPDYETEIGAGVSAKLCYIDKSWLYWLRVDRWRGTKTNRLHGFEVGLGISYAVD